MCDNRLVPLLKLPRCLAAALFAASVLAAPTGRAAEQGGCRPAEPGLWGDGRHDDTKALNAWFKGETVVWAETGQPVGSEIVGHSFLLSSTVYIPSGTGRRLERFRMLWPARRERVTGEAILAGDNPDKPAVTEGVVRINAAPDEGVPYKAPAPKPAASVSPKACLVS